MNTRIAIAQEQNSNVCTPVTTRGINMNMALTVAHKQFIMTVYALCNFLYDREQLSQNRNQYIDTQLNSRKNLI